MNIAIPTINIPGVSQNMLIMAQRLDFLVERLSYVQEHDVMHAPELTITLYRHWVIQTQEIHQNLIRLGISKACDNHPIWTSLDKLTTDEISRVLGLIEKRLSTN